MSIGADKTISNKNHLRKIFYMKYLVQSIQEWTEKKIVEGSLLKLLKRYVPKADHTSSNLFKAVFHKLYLGHS